MKPRVQIVTFLSVQKLAYGLMPLEPAETLLHKFLTRKQAKKPTSTLNNTVNKLLDKGSREKLQKKISLSSLYIMPYSTCKEYEDGHTKKSALLSNELADKENGCTSESSETFHSDIFDKFTVAAPL